MSFVLLPDALQRAYGLPALASRWFAVALGGELKNERIGSPGTNIARSVRGRMPSFDATCMGLKIFARFKDFAG